MSALIFNDRQQKVMFLKVYVILSTGNRVGYPRGRLSGCMVSQREVG